MEKFRELSITVDKEHTKALIDALDGAVSDGWSRAVEAEKRGKNISSPTEEFYYYQCDKRANREAAMVALFRDHKNPQNLYASNVVPTQLSQLTHGQYNAVLQDFCDKVLSRARPTFAIQFLLGSDRLEIESLMPSDVFKLLEQFSGLANKSTGSAHPMDQERWFVFLIALRRNKHTLTSDALGRWLVEVKGWSDEVAQNLKIEYEFAMGLLDYQDSH